MKRIIPTIMLFLTFISCSTDNVNDIETQEKEIILNNSNSTKRIDNTNIGVISIKEAPSINPNEKTPSFSKTNSDDIASDIPLTLIAEVSAPTYKGNTLKATHVDVNNNYVYVSYNVEGSKYLGGIDVINISDPTKPVVELEAIFPNTDVSSVKYFNEKLYLAGASSSYDIDESNPAILMSVELSNGLLTENLNLFDLSSYVATDVFVSDKGIFSVSGDNGDLFKFNLYSSELEYKVPLEDLRAIGGYKNQIFALSGTNGLFIYNENNLKLINTFSTSNNIAESKRTIDFFDNNVLVAEGKDGLGIYNISSGNKSSSISLPEIADPNINLNEVVTNSVTVTNNHVFMANGAAGLTVHDLENGINDITKTGTLDIDGSTNYVKSTDDYIFVASGDGGLKIIKIIESDNNGTSISCTDLPTYKGSSWLNINSNDPKSYGGSLSLNGLNINDDFTFCGSLAISKGLNINSGGNFYMSGSLAQGSVYNKWNSFNINNKATLFIEGSLVVYGNMILNDGATIEFLGSGSSITVYGDVIKNGTVTIKGDYTDTFNKL